MGVHFAIPGNGKILPAMLLIEKNFPHHGAVAFGLFGKTVIMKYSNPLVLMSMRLDLISQRICLL